MSNGTEFEIRDSFDRDQVRSAQREFEAAESRLDSALQARNRGMSENSNMRFVDAQRVTERSTKAVFELMDVQYPSQHAIDPRSQEGCNLLHAVSNSVDDIRYFEENEGLIDSEELKRLHTGELARLLSLCYMFGNMYTLASYGINEQNIRIAADDFIQFSDYEYAVEYALAALRIADVIIDSIATGQLPYIDPPTGDGPLEGRSTIKGSHYGVTPSDTDFDPVKSYRREL